MDVFNGTYEIVTKSQSRYLLEVDMDKALVMSRVPSDAVGEINTLRKDGESFLVHEIISLEIGAPMVFLAQISENENVLTLRQTTPLESVQKIS